MAFEDNKNYWAFISYSSKDKKWGQWLHHRLENYPIPKDLQGQTLFDGAPLGKNLRPVFRDRDELTGSADLGTAIHRALEQSRFLVVLCSKNSAKSEWVNKEIADFKALGRSGNILALILDGEPNATSRGQAADECFPPELRYPAEPIAGDLRRDGDGPERGFIKVLAGIAQLDFDKLYRRHERQQARKRALMLVLALSLASVFGLLSAYALIQQQEAVKQRDLAFANEKRAIIGETAAKENEAKAKAAQILAEDRLAEVEAQKVQTELQRQEALRQKGVAETQRGEAQRQSAIAEQKYRDVLFGKYLTAKATGAQEEGITYLAEVLSLTRAAGHTGTQLASLLNFEQSQQSQVIWHSGGGLPLIAETCATGQGRFLLRDDAGKLWLTDAPRDGSTNLSFKRFGSELGSAKHVLSLGSGGTLVLAGDKLYLLNGSLAATPIFDLGPTQLVRWFDWDPADASVMLLDNQNLVRTPLARLSAGAGLSATGLPLPFPSGTTIFDFTYDPRSRLLACRTNEQGQRRLTLVDTRTGQTRLSIARRSGTQPVGFSNGRFTYCSSPADYGSDLFLIDPAKPEKYSALDLPWDNPRLVPRSTTGWHLMTDQGILRFLSPDGKIEPVPGFKPSPLQGETALGLAPLGRLLLVSTRHRLEALDPDSPGLPVRFGQSQEKIDHCLPLDGQRVVTNSWDGWQVRSLKDGGVIASGSEGEGLLAGDGAGFIAWENGQAVLADGKGARQPFALGGYKPVQYFAAARLLVAAKDSKLFTLQLESSGAPVIRQLPRAAPDLVTRTAHFLTGISWNATRSSVDIWVYDLDSENETAHFFVPASLKSNESLQLDAEGSSVSWIDANGQVAQLALDAKNPGGVRRSPTVLAVARGSHRLVPVGSAQFALANADGTISLYQNGNLAATFVAVLNSQANTLLRISEDTLFVCTDNGDLCLLRLPLLGIRNAMSPGKDASRSNGPLFQMYRDNLNLVLAWNDGKTSHLSPRGGSTDGFAFIAQNSSQTMAAAIDKGQSEIMVWKPAPDVPDPAPLQFTNDDTYGGLWFDHDNRLLASVDGKLLSWQVGSRTLQMLAPLALPGLKRANLFSQDASMWYFSRYGERVIASLPAGGGTARNLYAPDSLYSLLPRPSGLLLGMTDYLLLIDKDSGKVIRRFNVPSDGAGSWYVVALAADPERDWIFCAHGPRLLVFQESTGAFVGKLDLPDIPRFLSINPESPDRLFVAGTQMAFEIRLMPRIRDLKAFQAALPYTIAQGELTVKSTPVVLGRKD